SFPDKALIGSGVAERLAAEHVGTIGKLDIVQRAEAGDSVKQSGASNTDFSLSACHILISICLISSVLDYSTRFSPHWARPRTRAFDIHTASSHAGRAL